MAVEQYNNKLSMVLDANGILTQAFEKLKKEAGMFFFAFVLIISVFFAWIGYFLSTRTVKHC